jgi:hypothetical protein
MVKLTEKIQAVLMVYVLLVQIFHPTAFWYLMWNYWKLKRNYKKFELPCFNFSGEKISPTIFPILRKNISIQPNPALPSVACVLALPYHIKKQFSWISTTTITP